MELEILLHALGIEKQVKQNAKKYRNKIVYAGKTSDDGMRNIKGAACMNAKARDVHTTIITCVTPPYIFFMGLRML